MAGGQWPRACFKTGVSNFWDLMPDDVRWADVIIIEIKCSINVMHLNHPKTTLQPCPGPWKNFSMKPVSGAKKVGDRCFKE